EESQGKQRKSESRSRLYKSTPNLIVKISTSSSMSSSSSLSIVRSNLPMMPPNQEICDKIADNSQREEELRSPLRRGSSLNFKRLRQEQDAEGNRLRVPDSTNNGLIRNNNETYQESSSIRPARYSAPAPEQLAISLLQLGCPLVSMPRPRGGVGSAHSSDSDDSISSHNNQRNQRHNPSGNTSPEGYGLPKVQISGPPDSCESSHTNG
ncbi:hypothetical protein KQX54_010149, partial [Cotesia glomerata]